MKTPHIYTAFEAEISGSGLSGHITTSFTKIEGKMPKLSTKAKLFPEAHVCGIAYWPVPNVTVALVTCNYLHARHQHWMGMGLKYEHTFVPHITLGSGNKVSEFENLIGCVVELGKEYIGFIYK